MFSFHFPDNPLFLLLALAVGAALGVIAGKSRANLRLAEGLRRERDATLAAEKAKSIILGIAKDIEVGEVYTGKVVRIMNFGAFVELAPGKDGMVHISKLADHRVEKVEDVVKIGDELEVRVTEIDAQGRINLVRNDITYTQSDAPRRTEGGNRSRPPRRDGRSNNNKN